MKNRLTKIMAFILAITMVLCEMPVIRVNAQESVSGNDIDAHDVGEGTVSENDPEILELVPGHDYTFEAGTTEIVINAESEDDLGLYELRKDTPEGLNIWNDSEVEDINITSCGDLFLINVKKLGKYTIYISTYYEEITVHCSNIYKIKDFEIIDAPTSLYEGWDSIDYYGFNGKIKLIYENNAEELLEEYSDDDYNSSKWACFRDISKIDFLIDDTNEITGQPFTGWKIVPDWCEEVKYVDVNYYGLDIHNEGILSVDNPIHFDVSSKDRNGSEIERSNYSLLEIDEAGSYTIEDKDGIVDQLYLMDSELNVKYYPFMYNSHGYYETHHMVLEAGTYYMRSLGSEEYMLSLKKVDALQSMEIVSEPVNKKAIRLYGNRSEPLFMSYAGLEIKLTFESGETQNIAYGSKEWNDAHCYCDESFYSGFVTVNCNKYNASADIEGIEIVDGKTIAKELTADSTSISLPANIDEYRNVLSPEESIIGINIDEEGAYSFCVEVEDYDTESGDGCHYGQSLDYYDELFYNGKTSFSKELEVGYYCFYYESSENIKLSIKPQTSMENVTYKGVKNDYVAKLDSFPFHDLVIEGEIDGEKVSFGYYGSGWHKYGFSISFLDENKEKISYSNEQGKYYCVITSRLLEEDIVIPITFHSIEDFVQYELNENDPLEIQENLISFDEDEWEYYFDYSYAKIQVSEPGTYKLVASMDHPENDYGEEYCQLRIYDSNCSLKKSQGIWDYERSIIVYLSNETMYMKVGASSNVTFTLERVNGIADLSIKRTSGRDVYYCGLDDCDSVISDILLEATFEDSSKLVVEPYEDYWDEYGFNVNDEFNTKIPGDKVLHFSTASGVGIDHTVNFVSPDEIPNSITIGTEYEGIANRDSYGSIGECWLKLSVNNTRYYSFDVTMDGPYYSYYDIALYSQDGYLESGFESVKLYKSNTYYIRLRSRWDYRLLVEEEEYIDKVDGIVDRLGNPIQYIDKINFIPDEMYIAATLTDGTVKNYSVHSKKFSVQLFNDQGEEFDDEEFYWYYDEVYPCPVGDYTLRVTIKYTADGSEKVNVIPFKIYSLDEMEKQILGNTITRNPGGRYICLEAPEDGLYMLEYDEIARDCNKILYNSEKYTIFPVYSRYDRAIFNLEKGLYIFEIIPDIETGGEITIPSKTVPTIVSWDWSDNFKEKILKSPIPTSIGAYSYWYDMSITAEFDNGKTIELTTSTKDIDGIPYSIDTFFMRDLYNNGGMILGGMENYYKEGQYDLYVFLRSDLDDSKHLEFTVVKDIDYFDNVISLNNPGRLNGKVGIISISQSGFYSIVSDEVGDKYYYYDLYKLVDGNSIAITREEQNGTTYVSREGNRVNHNELVGPDVCSPLKSIYLEAGDYLISASLLDGNISLVKHKDISSVSVTKIPTLVLKEIGFDVGQRCIEVDIEYTDRSVETVMVDILDLCECNFATYSATNNIEISIVNNSIADRSWLRVGGGIRVDKGAIKFEKEDDNYYWVIEDKISHTTNRVNFSVDSMKNYDKILTPGGKINIEQDERLGYALVAVDVPDTASYSFELHKRDNTLIIGDFNLESVETGSLVPIHNHNWLRNEDSSLSIYINFSNAEDNCLSEGLYLFTFDEPADFYDISLIRPKEITGLSDIKPYYSLNKNVFLEGDPANSAVPSISAKATFDDGTEKEGTLVGDSQNIYTQDRSGQMILEIKKKDGSDPEYDFDYARNWWTGNLETVKSNLLKAGDYCWNIYSNDRTLLASLDFYVVSPQDAISHEYEEEFDITDENVRLCGDSIVRKVIVPEGKKYKLTVPTLSCNVYGIEIISDVFNDLGVAEKKTFYRRANEATEDIVFESGTYVIRGLLSDCSVTDISEGLLSAPVIKSLSQVGENIKIAWEGDENADEYEIYRSANSGSYTSLAKVSGNVKEYTDTSSKVHGAKYSYKICALNEGETGPASEASFIVYVGPVLAPSISSITNSEAGNKLTWSKINSATGYDIYVSIAGASYTKVTTISNVNTVTYTHSNIQKGKVYKYKVRAFNSLFTGNFSNEYTAPVLLAAPTLKSIANQADGVNITWDKSEGATGYEIMRRAGSGSFVSLTILSGANTVKYTDKSAKSGTVYTYAVKAVSSNSKSAAGKELSITFLATASITSSSGKCEKIELKWNTVNGADGYYIYRKKGSGSYSLYTTVSGATTVSYKDTHVDLGTTYTYKIEAKKGNYKAAVSNEVSVKVSGHSYTKSIVPATVAKDGSIVSTCSVCKAKKTEKIPAAKKISLSGASFEYSGKVIKPKVSICDSNGKAISSSYYTISYENNKNIGTASVKIVFKGNYKGTVTKKFKIVPVETKVKKITPLSKSFKLDLTPGKGADGYEIHYSTSDKFKSVNKKMYKKSVKSVTYNKLKAKTNYYVRVRSYKNVKEGGKEVAYYSDWSTTLIVKTK